MNNKKFTIEISLLTLLLIGIVILGEHWVGRVRGFEAPADEPQKEYVKPTELDAATQQKMNEVTGQVVDSLFGKSSAKLSEKTGESLAWADAYEQSYGHFVGYNKISDSTPVLEETLKQQMVDEFLAQDMWKNLAAASTELRLYFTDQQIERIVKQLKKDNEKLRELNSVLDEIRQLNDEASAQYNYILQF